MTHDTDWLPRSEPGYAGFRFALIQRIMAENLLPDQVADILEAAKPQFPQILTSEITAYREMRDVWDYYPGSRDWQIHRSVGEDAKAKVKHRIRENCSPWPSPLEVKASQIANTLPGLLPIEQCEAIVNGLTPQQAEPLLEKRYENIRPNFSGPAVDESFFASPDGKRAMERWAGRK